MKLLFATLIALPMALNAVEPRLAKDPSPLEMQIRSVIDEFQKGTLTPEKVVQRVVNSPFINWDVVRQFVIKHKDVLLPIIGSVAGNLAKANLADKLNALAGANLLARVLTRVDAPTLFDDYQALIKDVLVNRLASLTDVFVKGGLTAAMVNEVLSSDYADPEVLSQFAKKAAPLIEGVAERVKAKAQAATPAERENVLAGLKLIAFGVEKPSAEQTAEEVKEATA